MSRAWVPEMGTHRPTILTADSPTMRVIPICATLLTLLTACRHTPSEPGASLYGRWEKLETSLPPITLELRRGTTGPEGQVWLSGTTYTLPAVVDDTSVVLANPASSALAPFVGVLQKDGRLRVRLQSGVPAVEAYLVRQP